MKSMRATFAFAFVILVSSASLAASPYDIATNPDRHARVRDKAVKSIANSKQKNRVETLVKLLSSISARSAQEAILTMPSSDKQRALGLLQKALDRSLKDETISAYALLNTLHELSKNAAQRAYLKRARAENDNIRADAMQALERYDDDLLVEETTRILIAGTQDLATSKEALKSLSRIRRVRPSLIEGAFQKYDSDFRSAMCSRAANDDELHALALKGIDDAKAKEFGPCLSAAVRRRKSIGSKNVEQKLIQLLKTRDKSVVMNLKNIANDFDENSKRSVENALLSLDLKSFSSDKGIHYALDGLLLRVASAKSEKAIADLIDAFPNAHGGIYEAFGFVVQTPSVFERYSKWRRDNRRQPASVDRVLKTLRGQKLARFVTPLLKSESLGTQRLAIKALGRIGDPKSSAALLDIALSDDRRQTREGAASALAFVADPKGLPRMRAAICKKKKRDIARSFARVSRVFGHKEMAKLLNSCDEKAAFIALGGLMSDVHPSDEAILLSEAARADSRARYALDGLASIRTDASLKALCKALNNRDLGSNAARALGRYGGQGAAQCLVKQLARVEHRDAPSWNEAIQRALREITGERLGKKAEPWRALLKAGLSSQSTLQELWDALFQREKSQAMIAVELLNERYEKGQKKERKNLRALWLEALPQLKNDGIKAQVALSLAKAQARDAIPLLLLAFESARRDAKVEFARSLDLLGDAQGTLHYLKILQDGSSSSSEREGAMQALSYISGEPPHYDVTRWQAWWKDSSERYRMP